MKRRHLLAAGGTGAALLAFGGAALYWWRPARTDGRFSGRHWQLTNLSVHDSSIFPTRIGANPQLSIYGIVNRLATALARSLSGREVRLA